MEYLRLSDCSYFSSKRTSKIDYETYISTENMIQNKGGITIAETLPLIKSTSKYEEGDILLSNIRPYFKKIWLANREGGCSNDVLVIKSKDGFDNKFLYYVLSDDNFFNYDTITSKGTKMPRGTPNAIMKYLVPKISLIKQQKIADILSAYDELIENNNRQIEILEQEAEELYKEWFVRHKHIKYDKLGKIVTIKSGYAFESKDWTYEGYKVVKIKDIDNGFVDINNLDCVAEKAAEKAKKFILNSGDLVIAMTGATIGKIGLVFSDEKLYTNQRVGKFFAKTKFDIVPFLFCYFMQNHIRETILMFSGSSSAQPNISGNLLEKLDIPFDKDLLKSFCIVVKKIIDSIIVLQKQNELLKQQRDLLLPRLMSGKLDVCVKEKTVINDKFNDVREYWQKVKYDKNNFGIAARSNGKISAETLQKLKEIAEEDD